MELKVAVYDSHEKAINAINKLKENGFSMDNISLVGKADVIDDHIYVKSYKTTEEASVLIGAGAGTLVGLLTGLGVFAIPGFGFLYGAGAIVGLIGGFDIGLIAGGLGGILTSLGITDDKAVKYEQHLKEDKFILLLKGPMDKIRKAEHVLHTEGTHVELD